MYLYFLKNCNLKHPRLKFHQSSYMKSEQIQLSLLIFQKNKYYLMEAGKHRKLKHPFEKANATEYILVLGVMKRPLYICC